MTAKVDHENFVGGVREAVRDALAEKEEADRLSKVEELLQASESTINGLTDTITNKDAEMAASTEERDALLAKVAELETKATELEERLSEANKGSDEHKARAATAEKELASIEDARVLEVRMAELVEAKIASSGEEALAAQAERIGGMSEEDFSSYKQERVALRTQLETELKAQAEATAAQEAKENKEGAGVDDKTSDLETANKEKAAAAAAAQLDIEVPSEDLKTKYKAFGETLARKIAGNSRE